MALLLFVPAPTSGADCRTGWGRRPLVPSFGVVGTPAAVPLVAQTRDLIGTSLIELRRCRS